jgi:flagellar FliJ protein
VAKRFVFKLQTLLELRQRAEDEAKRKLAAKGAEIAQVDQLNREAAEAIRRQHAGLYEHQQGAAPDLVTLQRGRTWVNHLRRTIAQRDSEKARLQMELHELQDALRKARTQTRIIEKLRERRWETYRRDLKRREQAEMDELAQQLQVYAEQE